MKPKRKKKPPQKAKRALKAPQTSTAIVPVAPAPAVHWRERALSQDKIDLLKRTVAKGTDNDQFALFMQVCQRHGLDPFTKQIYCVLFPESKHHQEKKQTENGVIDVWVSGHTMVIMTGIGGYRMMAARDHKDYAGSSEAKFTWFDPEQRTPAGRRIPESATIQILRRGGAPTTATVYWEEFAPGDLKASRSDFWNRMPKNQLEKCAEAKGLRKAFPGLGDIFTDVELSQRLQDLTPGGRQITDDKGFAPSGRAVTYQAQVEESIDAEVESQKAGNLPGAAQPSVPAHDWKREQDKKADAPPRSQKAAEKPAERAYRGIIEIDQTNEADPILRGDLEDLLEQIKKHCNPVWKDDWWHIQPRDVETMFRMCQHFNYKVTHILPKPEPKTSASQRTAPAKATGAPPTQAKQETTKPAAARSAKEPPAVATVVTGTLWKVNTALTTKKQPMRQVCIMQGQKKVWYNAFDQKIFDFLDKGLGREVEVFVKGDKYVNIVGLKKIGGTEFEDGHLPVIQQKDREAGGKTLFS